MPEVLPELGALAAAGFLLLIAAALWVLQGLIRSSFGRLPVVGSWVAANIDAALNDARNAVLDGASSSWGAAKQLFRWTAAIVTHPIQAVITAFADVYAFASRVRNVYLPDLETRVVTIAYGWVSSAESYALGLYHTAVNYVNGRVDAVLLTASGWFTRAENDALSLFDTAAVDLARGIQSAETAAANALTRASTTLAADIRAAETFAASETAALAASTAGAVRALAGELATGIATAETIAKADTAALVGGVYTDLETWSDQALTRAWPDVQGDVGALRGTLGADFPWLKDLLGVIGGAGVLGLAGALARSAATSHALTRLASDCVVPQCRNLGGLSADLGNLLSDASTAAMLAWLIFGVTDPAGWAQETASVAGPAASELAQMAGHLFGG